MTRPRRWLAGLLATALLPVAALAAAPDAATEHVVREGETLNGIANRAKVSREAIAKANGLTEPYVVRVGQKLKIPRVASAATTKAAGTGRTASRTSATKPRTPTPVPHTGKAIPPDQETVHVVLPGESLGGIATRAKVPRVLIAEANGLRPPYTVKAGQKLHIPRTRRHTVKAGDTGFAIAYKYAVPWPQIAVANAIDPAAPVRAGQELLIPTLLDPPAASAENAAKAAVAAATAPAGRTAARFAWPLEGTLRRAWKARGSTGYHDGLDIVAPRGTAVRAAAAGTVLFAGHEKEQFGNLVVVDHGDGWHTAYAFLSRITVQRGAKVAAGERVGLVGDTGMAKGNELHFEIRRDGVPIDPEGQLPDTP